MGKLINTVTGPKPVEELGTWSTHEHAFAHGHEWDKFAPMNSYEKSLFELVEYKAAGGETLTDCGPVGAHRDADMLKRLSEGSGVNIIASTGYHMPGNYESDSPLLTLSEDELFEIYVHELNVGMYPWNDFKSELLLPSTDILAGNVKTAFTGRGDAEWFERHFKASARAALATDSTICVHTGGAGAITAAEKLLGWGIRPEKILLCHTDSTIDDFGYHETLGAFGVFLEYDRLGSHAGRSDHDVYDERVTQLILHMVDKGYDRVTVSMDITGSDNRSYAGTVPLSYTFSKFKEVFLSNGGTPELWHHIMVENPANHFGS